MFLQSGNRTSLTYARVGTIYTTHYINTGKMLISQGVALLFCREPIVSAHDLGCIAAWNLTKPQKKVRGVESELGSSWSFPLKYS